MRLKIEYENGLPTVDFNDGENGFLPYELQVLDGGKLPARESLGDYKQAIAYAFLGVVNRANGAVKGVTVEKAWMGGVATHRESRIWNAIVDTMNIIVFNVWHTEIEERLYMADGVKTKNASKQLIPTWNKTLVTPDSKNMKDVFVSAIQTFAVNNAKYGLGYTMRWENGLVLYDDQGNKVDKNDIAEDDMYTMVTLVQIIAERNRHLGVFFIDCQKMREGVVALLLDFIKEVYGDTFVFLQNCPESWSIKRTKIPLPNLRGIAR